MPKRCLVPAKEKKKKKKEREETKDIRVKVDRHTIALLKKTNYCIRNPRHCKHPALATLLCQDFAFQEKRLLTGSHFQSRQKIRWFGFFWRHYFFQGVILHQCLLEEQYEIGRHSDTADTQDRAIICISLTYSIQEVREAAVATDWNISMFAIDSNSIQIQKHLPAYLPWQSTLMATSCTHFCCCFSPT